jgi:hypothetical protein
MFFGRFGIKVGSSHYVYSRGAQLVGWQNGAHDECSESRQRKVEMNN